MLYSLCDCKLSECGVMDVEDGGPVIGGVMGLVLSEITL